MEPGSVANIGEHRSEKRFPFHWKVTVAAVDAADRCLFEGVTHEISLHGCSILTDLNVFAATPVVVRIALPAEKARVPQTIVEAQARMVYTVLAAGVQQFRCGLHFLNFTDSGRAQLKRAIAARAPACR